MVATRDFIVTDVPQDLTANSRALALASDQRWSIQNVDPRSRVFIRVAKKDEILRSVRSATLSLLENFGLPYGGRRGRHLGVVARR